MGSVLKSLIYAFIFSVMSVLFISFVAYFSDVNRLYDNQFKDYMYYGAKQSTARLNGVNFSDFDESYAIDCNHELTDCSEDSYIMLERSIVKYLALNAEDNSDIKYEVYVNEQTSEVYVHLLSGNVDSTIKIIVGENNE